MSSTCSRSSGWITLAKVRTLLPMKSAAGWPQIASISGLMNSIDQSLSGEHR